MVDNSVLRERARFQLGNNIFANSWLMMLVVCLIVSAIMSMASSATFGVAVFIVGGPLMYGLQNVTLSCARGLEWKIEHTFRGFSERFSESLVLYLLQTLFIFLWSLLFIIPGIVKTYAYALSFYVARDYPELDAKGCLAESEKLMDGHKWQLFCLDLSFIGWYFVGALCFGIGTLFVTPYHELARANFYAELKLDKENSVHRVHGMGNLDNSAPADDCFSEFNS